jgi:hypothetical protein
MIRQGVLSDLAIKQAHPESFPLDIGSSISAQEAHLPLHPFRGIKLPRNIKNKKTVARFPINDIKNSSAFLNPSIKHQEQFKAIMEYRQKFDSDNVPQNLEIAYDQRLKGNYQPILYKAPTKQQIEMATQTASASIRLYPHKKSEGAKKFNMKNPEYQGLLSERSKATLYGMADEEHHPHLLNVLFPSFTKEGDNKKISDAEFKHTLSSYYFDSPSDIEIMNKAYNLADPIHEKAKIFPPPENEGATREKE